MGGGATCRPERRRGHTSFGCISERPNRTATIIVTKGVPILSMNTDEAHRRAEALFKKEQQQREAQKAMAEYQAGLDAMREKTARLRALRLARDAANPDNPKKPRPAKQKGAA
jgi:hypothetical protein